MAVLVRLRNVRSLVPQDLVGGESAWLRRYFAQRGFALELCRWIYRPGCWWDALVGFASVGDLQRFARLVDKDAWGWLVLCWEAVSDWLARRTLFGTVVQHPAALRGGRGRRVVYQRPLIGGAPAVRVHVELGAEDFADTAANLAFWFSLGC